MSKKYEIGYFYYDVDQPFFIELFDCIKLLLVYLIESKCVQNFR